jgi:hypothetical protein
MSLKDPQDGSLPTDMQAEDFILWALHHHEDFDDRRWQAKPWLSRLFTFVRILKAHDLIRDVDARAAFGLVQRVLGAEVGTKDPEDIWSITFEFESAEDAEVEFLFVWDAARLPAGTNVLSYAASLSSTVEIDLPPLIAAKRSNGYRRFLSFARVLQRVMRDANIYLPCREVGEVLKVRKNTIQRYRSWALADGFLIEKKRFTFHLGRHEATEFQFADPFE